MNRKKNIINKLVLTDPALDRAVKLVGTDHDRRRKLSNHDVKRIVRLYDEGYSLAELADIYCVNSNTIKYHVNEDYRNYQNTIRSQYNVTKVKNRSYSDSERVRYKRSLISKGVL